MKPVVSIMYLKQLPLKHAIQSTNLLILFKPSTCVKRVAKPNDLYPTMYNDLYVYNAFHLLLTFLHLQ